MTMTNGKAYYDDEDDDEVAVPMDRFNDEWIEGEQDTSIDIVRTLTKGGHEITMDGLFCTICVGPKMFQAFDIPLSGDYDKADKDRLMDHLCYYMRKYAN